MTPQEILELERFVNNPIQFEAVRRIFYDEVDLNKKLRLKAVDISDAQLGSYVRSMNMAADYLDEIFKELKKYKKVERQTSKSVVPR
jgi:hypothetical protein